VIYFPYWADVKTPLFMLADIFRNGNDPTTIPLSSVTGSGEATNKLVFSGASGLALQIPKA
jgi:hypothetical protein